ncbi:hypothetical protein K445DRAFT_141956 [Daldinia sp. EC12]|nr:hypothetical protein K445DRAFT_141956 [Daldinia sp. EC12]
MPDPKNYTIGWICALSTELVAAQALLDQRHDMPEWIPVNDNNTYVLGQMGKHSVVIAALPQGEYGLVSAATVARDMVRSFPNVRLGLMVGIGGGAPSKTHDIRLGDVVVSVPGNGNGGVFQYDYGKTVQDQKFAVTGHLNQPPQAILGALSTLKADYATDGHSIERTIDDLLQRKPRLQRKFKRPDDSTDVLYHSGFTHQAGPNEDCLVVCGNNESNIVARAKGTEGRDKIEIHYGLIASANQLVKDARVRDRLSEEMHVLCFEMEAAGLMNHFPCLAIRGICAYSDTHNNKGWQGYAAMTAAAFAKDLLRYIAPNRVEAEWSLSDVMKDVRGDINSMRISVDGVKDDQHLNKLRTWLSAPDSSTNFNTSNQLLRSASLGIQDIFPFRNDEIGKDIKACILSRFQTSEQLKRWQNRPDVQEEIVTSLMEKSDGMFR